MCQFEGLEEVPEVLENSHHLTGFRAQVGPTSVCQEEAEP